MIDRIDLTDSLIEAPTQPALTLAYAKLHIRSLGAIDDALIAVFIDAATSYFEEQTGRQLITATREAWLDAFPFVGASGSGARIELPHPPLRSLVSVRYIDAGGVLQNFTGGSPLSNLYTISAPAGDYARRGFVEPVYGQMWPIAREDTQAVRIRYTCGYGDTPADIPKLVRGILCYLVGHFDTFRSAVVEARNGPIVDLPFGVQMMMDGFKYSALSSQVLRAYRWPQAFSEAWPVGFGWGSW